MSRVYVGEWRRFGSVRVDYVRALRLGEPMTTGNLLFVDCDTDTVETIRGASFIIDTDISALSDDERGILTDAYDYGVFGPNACRIIERVGVPVADLWAAYKREQQRESVS